MEQSAAFKDITSMICNLEKQLAQSDFHTSEEYVAKIEKQIEEHFSRCLNSLFVRKAALLAEVGERIAAKIISSYKKQK
jgi:predicted house-cleaning noncanonical NTP pyrophosphatase (MazG superfamily)